MAAFTELDWRRFDVLAIVESGGLATIDESRHAARREWLSDEGYKLDVFDCRPGLESAIPALGRMLRWEEQFGYVLDSQNANLKAVRDGFLFDVLDGGGRVFEIIRADLAWREDPAWLLGFLSIVRAESRRQLALGRRFFGMLVVSDGSPLIGSVIEEASVPCPS